MTTFIAASLTSQGPQQHDGIVGRPAYPEGTICDTGPVRALHPMRLLPFRRMDTDHPPWEPQPDGSWARLTNGIRVTLRGHRPRTAIEHLVTWQEDGSTHILGLDLGCRPVYLTAFSRS
jgi:hypothetical protein